MSLALTLGTKTKLNTAITTTTPIDFQNRITYILLLCFVDLTGLPYGLPHFLLVRFAGGVLRPGTPHHRPFSDKCVFQVRFQAATAISPTLIRLSTLRTPGAFQAARSASSRSNNE